MHPRQTRLIKAVFTFVFFFVLIPPFAALIGDRPSQVGDPNEEGFFANVRKWISAVFHVILAQFILQTYGALGFLLLPLTVLIVARRLSAAKGIPYFVKDLRADVVQLLTAPKNKAVVLYGTAVTLVLDLTTLFGLPTAPFSALGSVFIWVIWTFIAFKASQLNVIAAQAEQATRDKLVGMLSKAFSVPLSEWDNAEVIDEGLRVTVTPPPMGAVLHYAQADGILALIAPQYEMNITESDHEQLILDEASEETKQRREEEKLSGGLIAGKISEIHSPSAAPAFAGVSISADDLI